MRKGMKLVNLNTGEWAEIVSVTKKGLTTIREADGSKIQMPAHVVLYIYRVEQS